MQICNKREKRKRLEQQILKFLTWPRTDAGIPWPRTIENPILIFTALIMVDKRVRNLIPQRMQDHYPTSCKAASRVLFAVSLDLSFFTGTHARDNLAGFRPHSVSFFSYGWCYSLPWPSDRVIVGRLSSCWNKLAENSPMWLEYCD